MGAYSRALHIFHYDVGTVPEDEAERVQQQLNKYPGAYHIVERKNGQVVFRKEYK